MRHFRTIAYAAVVAMSMSMASSVAAQSDADTERARALFTEGVTLINQGRHQDAVDKFSQALELRRAPSIHFNLGLAYLELGRLGRAADHFEAVAEDPETERPMRRDARQAIRRLRSQLGTVTVNVEGDIAGTALELDGWPIPAERIGMPLRAAEGTHRLTASRGSDVGGRSVEVTTGEDTAVTLRLGAPSAAEAARAGADEETPWREQDGPADGSSITDRWWFWTAIGVLVAGAVFTGVVLAQPGDPDPIRGNLNPGFVTVNP